MGRSVRFLSLSVILVAIAVLVAAATAGMHAAGTNPLSAFPPPAPALSADDLSSVIAWDADVSPRNWTAIVLHHSATDAGSAASFDTYHRLQKGWQSLGYDFVIGNGNGTPDGAIEAGPRWRRQEVGAHANSIEFNRQGIGICLVGNFENQPPTPAQLASARALVRELARRFHIPPERILGHCDIREGGGTACPGKHLPMNEFRQRIRGESR